MLEESVALIPSFWESMISWFTPTVLFLLLNLVIGTILFTSNTNHHNNHEQKPQNQNDHHQQGGHHQQQQQQTPQKIARSSSVLQRIKSINFYPYRSQETTTTTHFKQQNKDFPPLVDQTLETAATQYVFNPVLLETQSPNSLPNFSFDQTHLQELPTNPLPHFDFDQSHLQELPTNPLPHFDFDQSHLQKTPIPSIDHFVSAAQTHYQENPLAKTHFVYAHEDTQIINPHFDFPQIPKETATQFVFDQTHVEKSVNEPEEETEELQSMDEIYSKLTQRHVTRTTSDTKPASGEILKKLPEKMKKSASMKSAFSHFEEEKIVEARRPATMRERGPKIPEEDDGEVDAKADDFINKFKHQLKLQRIDSIIRYKDTITRRSEK